MLLILLKGCKCIYACMIIASTKLILLPNVIVYINLLKKLQFLQLTPDKILFVP